jgi:hypothetical protein
MIPRISKGTSAYGALAYDHGPGRRDEHTNAHKVAGNVPGRTWRERARVIDSHTKTVRGDISKPLHRTSLRVAENDRALTDHEWKQVANEYIERMGLTGCPWEATRHADDHIHITVSRVQWDGKVAKVGHDYARAQAASRHIERAHGLQDASLKYDRSRPQVSKGERESGERRKVTPEREQLREKLRAAERASDGTRESYEEHLGVQGVRYRANVSKTTGRVSGYSYGLDDHVASPKGERGAPKEPVWFKGSQIGGDFSWSKTQHRLTELAAGRGEPAAGRIGMTRAEARAEAARRSAERARPQIREDLANPGAEGRPKPAGPLTREQAKDEAARRAAERRQNTSRTNEQEGRER